MRFIGLVSLGLVLVALGGCTYKFPDPKDASRVYACAADGDCASGFSCIDRVCVDTQKFGTKMVKVQGLVTEPASQVYTTLKGAEFSTAVGAGGTFELDIPVGDGTDVVALYSRGPATLPHVQLASILGDTNRLQQLAAAGAVTKDLLGELVLTPFATAVYGAILAANDGALPASNDELVAAEQNLTYAYTEDQLLDAAGAVHYLAQTSSTTVASTLALVTDADALRTFVTQARSLTPPPGDPITIAESALVADHSMTAVFRSGSMTRSYLAALQDRHGLEGYSDERVVLAGSGTGTYHGEFYPGGAVPTFSTLTWSVDGDGGISATFSPQPVEYIDMSGIELASYFPDQATKTSVVNAVGADVVSVALTVASMRVRLLASSEGADWVAVTKHGNLGLADALSYYSLTGTDQVADAPVTSRVWLRTDAFKDLPWPALATNPSTNTWAMQVVLPSDISFSGDVPGTTVVSTSYVTFGTTGIATATGGVIPKGTSVNLQWSLTADGILKLTYPGGVHTQRMALWDTQSPLYGMLTWHAPDGATEYLSYGAARVVDLTSFSAAAVTTADGEYWQTQINGAWYPPEAGDAVPRNSWFGWELHSDQTAIQRQMYQPTPGGPYQWMVLNWAWRLEGNDVVVEAHRNFAGTYSSCTVGGADPSCFVTRRRRWQPVSISSARDRTYVIESDTRYMGPLIKWNGTQWVLSSDSTTPVDPTSYLAYSITPRFNVYDRLPVGQ